MDRATKLRIRYLAIKPSAERMALTRFIQAARPNVGDRLCGATNSDMRGLLDNFTYNDMQTAINKIGMTFDQYLQKAMENLYSLNYGNDNE